MVLDSYRIIHISDLHFGKKHATTHDSSLRLARVFQKRLNIPISELIFDEMPSRKRERVKTIVICSGDLATTDQPRDFTEAVKFLNRFTREYDIPSTQIILVPGNHDVHWDDYSPTYDFRMFELFKRRFRTFRNPFRRDGPCYYFPEHRLLVYCINSCVLCGAKEEIPSLIELLRLLPRSRSKKRRDLLQKLTCIDPGFVGREQLMSVRTNTEKVLSSIDRNEKKYLLKIAVLHHHVNPLYPEIRRFASVIDAVPFKEVLYSEGFHILLHGHKHCSHYCHDTTFADRDQGVLAVLASGTMGGELPRNQGYSFNVLDVRTYESRIPRVSVSRIEDRGDGVHRSSINAWPLNLEGKERRVSDQRVNSLIGALSQDLPVAFARNMTKLHQKYRHHNPVEVRHYKIIDEIQMDHSRRFGTHTAQHTLKFQNRNDSFLKELVIFLTGSRSVEYDKLDVSAKYKTASENRWRRLHHPEFYYDCGFIKVVGYPFEGKGLSPGAVAWVKIKYRWPNTVEFPDSEWGIENWLFEYGIKKFSLKCLVKGNLKIKRALAHSIHYDQDRGIYEGRQVENLRVPKNGKSVRWDKALAGRTQTLHSIRITLQA